MTLRPLFYERDFQGLAAQPEGLTFSVDSLSKSAIGGPDRASISAAGETVRLYDAANWLRRPVEIVDEMGRCAWWGYVRSVRFSSGVGYSLDGMSNRAKVVYSYTAAGASSATSGVTAWGESTTSAAIYGKKEMVLTSTGNAAMASSLRDRVLATLASPVQTTEFPGQAGALTAVIECGGWWETLGWRYASNFDTTIMHDPTTTVQITPQMTSAVISFDATYRRIEDRYAELAVAQGERIILSGTVNSGSYLVSSTAGLSRGVETRTITGMVLANGSHTMTDTGSHLGHIAVGDDFFMGGDTAHGGDYRCLAIDGSGSKLTIDDTYGAGVTLNNETTGEVYLTRGSYANLTEAIANEASGSSVTIKRASRDAGRIGMPLGFGAISNQMGFLRYDRRIDDCNIYSPLSAFAPGDILHIDGSGSNDSDSHATPFTYHVTQATAEQVTSITSDQFEAHINASGSYLALYDNAASPRLQFLAPDDIIAVSGSASAPINSFYRVLTVHSSGSVATASRTYYDAGAHDYYGTITTTKSNHIHVREELHNENPCATITTSGSITGGSSIVVTNTAARLCQSFVPSAAMSARTMSIKAQAVGSPAQTLTFGLYANTSGSPASLVTGGSASFTGTLTTGGASWATATLPAAVSLTAGSVYWLDVQASGSVDPSNYYLIECDEAAGYTSGSMLSCLASSGSNYWSAPGYSLVFQVAETPETTAQIAYLAGSAQGGQFLAAVDVEYASGVNADRPDGSDVQVLSVVEDMLSYGSSGSKNILATVTRERILRIYQEPDKPTAMDMTSINLSIDGSAAYLTGEVIPGYLAPAGVWYWTKSVIPGGANASTQPVFVERVEWSSGALKPTTRGQQDIWNMGVRNG